MRRLGRFAAHMPITVKAPVVVVLLMLAIGIAVSERVLSRLVSSQERQLVPAFLGSRLIKHWMSPQAVEDRLRPEDRAVLEARVRSPATTQRDALRARVVLLTAEGRSTRSIADELEIMPNTVSTWRARYAREGLPGLADKPRPGEAEVHR